MQLDPQIERSTLIHNANRSLYAVCLTLTSVTSDLRWLKLSRLVDATLAAPKTTLAALSWEASAAASCLLFAFTSSSVTPAEFSSDSSSFSLSFSDNGKKITSFLSLLPPPSSSSSCCSAWASKKRS